MLSIRLTRIGKKKQPIYRVIVLDKRKDPWGKSLEILGNYNPRIKPTTINLKIERIKYWLGVGAQPSTTVHNFLVDQKIIKDKKISSITVSKKRTKKNAEAKKGKETAENSKTPDSKEEDKKEETDKKTTKKTED